MTGKVEIVELKDYDAGYVMANLRGPDQAEMDAMIQIKDVAYRARLATMTATLGWCARVEVDENWCRPAAIYAVQQSFGAAFNIWMVATDEFPLVSKALMRHFVQVMVPAVRGLGARRLEARSLNRHREAHRWMERMGAVKETNLQDNGLNGELFYLYAWRLSDWKPHGLQYNTPEKSDVKAHIRQVVAATL